MEAIVRKDRSHWTLETMSFEEAEAQTRTYWKNASPEERLNAFALTGKTQAQRNGSTL